MNIYFDRYGIKLVRSGNIEVYDHWIERDDWIVPRYTGPWAHVRYLMQYVDHKDLVHAAYAVRDAISNFVNPPHPEELWIAANIGGWNCSPIASAIVVHTIYNVDLSDHDEDEDNYDDDLGCLLIIMTISAILTLLPTIIYALLYLFQ